MAISPPEPRLTYSLTLVSRAPEVVVLPDAVSVEGLDTGEVLAAGTAEIAATLQTRAQLELPDKGWFDVQELLSAGRVLGYEHRDIAALFQVSPRLSARRRAGNASSEPHDLKRAARAASESRFCRLLPGCAKRGASGSLNHLGAEPGRSRRTPPPGAAGTRRISLPEVSDQSEPSTAAAGSARGHDLPIGLDSHAVGEVVPETPPGEVRNHLAVATERGVEIAVAVVAGEREPAEVRVSGSDDLPVCLDSHAVSCVKAGAEVSGHLAVAAEGGVQGAVALVAG